MAEIRTLPLVPLRGMMVFPNMMINVDIGRPRTAAAVEAAMIKERQIFLVMQKDNTTEDPTRRDLY
ncbi:MAG: LON peptidase substrate-binding domain-containing protein, partial [Selenomonadaceae bacterium]|nr:LON peptidase substrate-binding domain-containing protein [Selenomonadaceae bacterium]